MTALVRAEMLKLRTRAATGLLLAALGMVVLTVATNVPKTGTAQPPVSLHDARLLASVVGTPALAVAAPCTSSGATGAIAFNGRRPIPGTGTPTRKAALTYRHIELRPQDQPCYRFLNSVEV